MDLVLEKWTVTVQWVKFLLRCRFVIRPGPSDSGPIRPTRWRQAPPRSRLVDEGKLSQMGELLLQVLPTLPLLFPPAVMTVRLL